MNKLITVIIALMMLTIQAAIALAVVYFLILGVATLVGLSLSMSTVLIVLSLLGAVYLVMCIVAVIVQWNDLP